LPFPAGLPGTVCLLISCNLLIGCPIQLSPTHTYISLSFDQVLDCQLSPQRQICNDGGRLNRLWATSSFQENALFCSVVSSWITNILYLSLYSTFDACINDVDKLIASVCF
jgi:hypothetical protein